MSAYFWAKPYFGYDEAGTTLTREGRDLLVKLNAQRQSIRIRVHHLLTSGDGTLALKWSRQSVKLIEIPLTQVSPASR